MSLFEWRREQGLNKDQPLAARMRPRTLEHFVGQDHIIGPGRLLRRSIEADRLGSIIFFGPPGTGKTTLAKIIANTTKYHFIALNAVLAGVKDLRAAVKSAQTRADHYQQKTILFIDEIHRFNKAQQDALLPWVENGTVTLIGATTENPYFEVNKALVSRSRIFQLKPLTQDDLNQIIDQTLSDPMRGFGGLTITIEQTARDHLTNVANGDARALLNAIEVAVETTVSQEDDSIRITLDIAEESIQKRAVLYDKEGDAHFDTISAYIKSLRGSDPDAALYWLAKMLYAGEEPRFIFRRMLISASEDIGLASPDVIGIVASCAAAYDRVGLPEGHFHLAHATLVLATAPKSNSTLGFFDAMKAVKKEVEQEVPSHLKDSSRDKKGFGHGEGYLYPHSYREHWVAQQYLPKSLQNRVFYQPGNEGFEAGIQKSVEQRREAQIAAMEEGTGVAPEEILTFSPEDKSVEQWLNRTTGTTGNTMAQIRNHIFKEAKLRRHHLVLDLNGNQGFFTWEAIRQVPEGQVVTLVNSEEQETELIQRADPLPVLRRPEVHCFPLSKLTPEKGLQNFSKLTFDRIIGRNSLVSEPDKQLIIASLPGLLAPKGRVLLAEVVPHFTQRLYKLMDPQWFDPILFTKLKGGEEAIYEDFDNPMVNWKPQDIRDLFEKQGFSKITLSVETTRAEFRITAALIGRWFSHSTTRKTYRDRLATVLTTEELESVHTMFKERLLNQRVIWEGQVAYVTGTKPAT